MSKRNELFPLVVGMLQQADARELDIRPLAKLSEAVKIADASNQREAESKAFSAIAVTFREDTKPFNKANGVFNKDTSA